MTVDDMDEVHMELGLHNLVQMGRLWNLKQLRSTRG